MIRGLYSFARKWSDGGSVWMISDTHFDDSDRAFMGYEVSEEEQISILKKYVMKNDTLIHLGDVGNPEYMKHVKGYKVLILGNHDFTASRFRPYFDEIYEGPLMISRKLILSHEPVDVPWAFNIHGHVHNPGSNDDHHLNLAANVFGYQPANLGRLITDGLVSNVDDIHRMTINNTKTDRDDQIED